MYTHQELETMIQQCSRCPLSQSRKQPVIGRGSLKADIMFVAEAPGAQEDVQGIPFVGPAGRVLDILLASAGLTRQDVYITNIIKCHPPGNRDPKPEEQEACIPFLRAETTLLRPPVIVCLGRIAAQKLIDPQFKITRQHGTWVHRKGYWMTAVYHPSAILRDPSKLEETKKDFQSIIQKLQEIEESKYPL
ncbi:MAG: uracil-DNA glycosylase [Peptococcaceae bacterium]|nr:uracil-DNA glycosylase [Peptococcaceae bacterium]